MELGQARFLDFEPEHVEVESTAEEFHLVLPPPSGDESPFSPAVLHIHDGLFATLARAEGGTTDPQSAHELRLTPAHWIFKIYVGQTTLRLNYFEPPGDVRTPSTGDLQRLALHYADDTSVFSSLSEWRRQTGGSQ